MSLQTFVRKDGNVEMGFLLMSRVSSVAACPSSSDDISVIPLLYTINSVENIQSSFSYFQVDYDVQLYIIITD